MSFFNMLLNDPVVFAAITGLLILLGICGYYVYYFISHVKNNE